MGATPLTPGVGNLVQRSQRPRELWGQLLLVALAGLIGCQKKAIGLFAAMPTADGAAAGGDEPFTAKADNFVPTFSGKQVGYKEFRMPM